MSRKRLLSAHYRGNEFIKAKKEMEQGNYVKSLEFINLSIANLERAIYFFFRGNVYEKLSKFEESYQDYKKAKDLSNDNPDYTYYENLGRICKKLGKFEEGIENYQQIIDSKTAENDHAPLALYHYEIGSMYDLLNKNKESYDFYSEAIDLENKNAIN